MAQPTLTTGQLLLSAIIPCSRLLHCVRYGIVFLGLNIFHIIILIMFPVNQNCGGFPHKGTKQTINRACSSKLEFSFA